MSDFNYQPRDGAQVRHAPRVLSAAFGDGYEQRVPDGINADLQEWSLSFTNTDAIIDAIDSFLQTKGGATAFTWTPRTESEVLVVCKEWTRTIGAGGISYLNATFVEVLA